MKASAHLGAVDMKVRIAALIVAFKLLEKWVAILTGSVALQRRL
jgi:hypothetical protein